MEEFDLTDEEIKQVSQITPEEYGAPPYWWLNVNRRVAKEAQKKLVGWLKYVLNDRGDYIGDDFGDLFRCKAGWEHWANYIGIPVEDWQRLLKLLGK